MQIKTTMIYYSTPTGMAKIKKKKKTTKTTVGKAVEKL